jgi:diaminohydroxyphosphoribosylaminopyrimidine deaminase / 5-amino-6-(5-phosphoribosylamino)uracil reductase
VSDDLRFLKRALQLANKARTHPNPCVGAVVVSNNQIVGEGWTWQRERFHAEVIALQMAGKHAHGATLYTTLEPCSHWQRPNGEARYPCSQHGLDFGIARVVCPIEDPNPLVSGRGFAQLRDAGVIVEVGLLAAKSLEVHRAFLKHQTTNLPFILHKVAMTLDGKIAARSDAPLAVTSAAARAHVHRLRNKCDALLVGVGTILADDPSLTTRLPKIQKSHQPAVVVFDSQLRTPTNAKIARPGTLILTTEFGDKSQHAAALNATGCKIIPIPSNPSGRIDVRAAAQFLADQGHLECLLECGGSLAAAFYEENLIDRVLYFIAPKLIGGGNAPSPIDGAGFSNAKQLGDLKIRRYGEDLAIEASLRSVS